MRLQDNGQVIDTQQRDLDETSNKTLGIGWEARKKSGLAFSIEYLNYRNEFTPPTLLSNGEARTDVLQFGGKKYFIDGGVFHPTRSRHRPWAHAYQLHERRDLVYRRRFRRRLARRARYGTALR
jgi:hypothetical protein